MLPRTADPFPGAHRAERVREEAGGNWHAFGDQEGWLCPALFDYFDHAPAELFVAAQEAEAEQVPRAERPGSLPARTPSRSKSI